MIGVDADKKVRLFGAFEQGAGFKREGDIARPRLIDVQTLFFQLRADPFGEGQRQVFSFTNGSGHRAPSSSPP